MKINTRDLGFINFNNEEMNWVKFNGQTVYEAWENLPVSGIPPLTLLNSGGKKLVDYKIYGNSMQSKLPSEYQQVEYIESTGEETLSTEYIDKPGTRIELDFIYTSIYNISTEMAYIGANAGNLLTISSDGYMSVAGNNTKDIVAIPNTRYNVILERDASGLRTGIINGVQKTGTRNTSAVNKFFLVGLGGSASSSKICGKIYSCRIYDNDILVRDLIPCYRISDSEVGLYDLANNVFYTNTGDGELSKGNNVPNTETPIEIESIGDKTNNLINWDLLLESEKITKVENGYYADTYLVSVAGSIIEQLKSALKPGVTYTLSRVYEGTMNASNGMMSFRYTIDDVASGVTVAPYGVGLKKGTFTLTQEQIENLKSIYIYFKGDGATIKNIQLEEGDTVTDYEPYGYRIPVRVSENLFNADTLTLNSAISSDGVMITSNNFSVTDYIKVNENENYKIKFYSPSYPITSGWYLRIHAYDENKQWLSNFFSVLINSDGEYVYEFTIPENCYYVKVSFFEQISNIVLNKEPIITNIYLNEPLRKIESYRDYIDFKKKQVVRNIYNEFITEIAGTSSVAGTYKIFLTLMEKTPKFAGYIGLAISNKFISHKSGYTSLPRNGGCIQTYITSKGLDRIALTFNDASITTVEQAQEKIGEGFDVCYVLEEPIIEENVELPDILLNKGTNIIEIDTKIQPSNMEVIYKGKIKK